MADERKSPQDIESELSVGNFAVQQGRTLGFQLGGLAAGLGLGYLANRMGAARAVGNKVIKWFGSKGAAEAEAAIAHDPRGVERIGSWVVSGAGAVIGMTVGGIASLYEHWVKVERERLSVQEINKDVANLMEKRVQFEDTLDKQHDIVKAMLKRQEEKESSISHAARESTRREERAATERQPG